MYKFACFYFLFYCEYLIIGITDSLPDTVCCVITNPPGGVCTTGEGCLFPSFFKGTKCNCVSVCILYSISFIKYFNTDNLSD